MNIVNILIIEDEAAQIQAYGDSISQYNKKNELKIEYKICKSYDEGEQALKTPEFDAAIIDLKLSGSDELEGEKLLKSVYKKIRIPIIVYSGSIAQLSDDIKECALLKKKLRTEKLSVILKEIVDIYNTGITDFLRPSGIIDKYLTEIFWNQDHLSSDLHVWIEHNNRNSLLRYILSRFQEHLDINVEGDFVEYHPVEVYIKPPIKMHTHTGDLIRYNGEYYVILTPVCDIVPQGGAAKTTMKADNIILVKAKDFDYEKICLGTKNILDKNKIDSFVKNKKARYHFLPPFELNNGLIIDFQDITSIKYSDSLDRIATISSPFIKDIISRFSNYYSRQGQPTFCQDSIVNQLYEK